MESVKFIGHVQSPLKAIGDCPLQEHEGAPPVLVMIDNEYREAVSGLTAGSTIVLLTWLHRSNRNTLTTKPRNDPKADTTGVFATRSPDRPNPIGLHVVTILEVIGGNQLRISNLEVLDGTPLIDIKPVLNNQSL
jgi:tRNA-Thr(GGU) m(6)t(6)A37 methyltransferase TsaA